MPIKVSIKFINFSFWVGEEYAISCNDNDILSMTLDMTGQVNATLSFRINDKDYGIAFDQVDIAKKYCMIVALYSSEKIKLLQ